MKRILQGLFFLTILICFSALYAQVAPSIQWQKSFGGSIGETANSVLQSTDGGFVFAGYTKSFDGDVSGNNGMTDYWVVKLDAAGNMLWQNSLGGGDQDAQWDFQPTSDGGFVVAGQSKSTDGDITGNHGDHDYWIVRLDAGGNIVWQKSLGGSEEDEAYTVQQTADGGFIVAGNAESSDGDVTVNHGEEDYWIVKLDADGNLMWQKSLGGSEEDEAYSVQQTVDGGYIIAGESESTDGDVAGNHGEGDYWIVKLDANGNLLWQKSYGGSSVDYPRMIKRTTDDGFIIAGWTSSVDGDVTDNNGDTDFWVIKLDAAGNLIWQKCLGGSDYDFAYSVQQTIDGGFIAAGYSHSNDGNVTGNHGSTDYWLVKLDVDGNLTWQKSLGGSDYDQAYAVQQTTDGDYIVAGLSFSNDGDVSGNHVGGQGNTQDCWIVKLTNDITGIPQIPGTIISVYPNPVQQYITIDLPNAAEVIIVVSDLQGRRMEITTIYTSTQVLLNTASLSAGFYTLQIMNNRTGTLQQGKFIKN
ncbi:MAG: T9SS type A sorting domain-containing protein [Chitinophagales bacterium]